MNYTPLVSICCLTYNHAPFIRQCLDGFLLQETTFPIEILIHDDCSTDGTDTIIKEYADKYPDLIFPLYEETNKYSSGWKGKMDLFNYDRARGKYIAYCEGDDYWTDPLKLQKQIDFLESHPDYSCCFHCFHVVNEKNEIVRDCLAKTIIPTHSDGVDVDIDLFFSHWYTQPMSMVYRHELWERDWHFIYKHFCDTYEIYFLLKKGKGRIMSFYGGYYRKHAGGIASGVELYKGCLTEMSYADELVKSDYNSHTLKYWKNTLLWVIDDLIKAKHKKHALILLQKELIHNTLPSFNVLYTLSKRHIKRTKLFSMLRTKRTLH